MFLKLLLIAVLAVLYGLAWHNEPAKRSDTHAPSKKPGS